MSRLSKILLGIIAAMFVILLAISGKYLDWLWFKTLGSTSVFWVSLLTGPVTKLIAGLVIITFFLINFFIALRAFDRIKQVDSFWSSVSKNTIVLTGLAASAILAFVISTGLSMDWTVIQQFLNQTKTGINDPFFNQDLSFYLFSFPFYQQLNILLVIVTFLGLAGTGLVYFLAKAYWKHGHSWELWRPAKIHLIFLTILFLIVKIWGYMLGKYGLLFQDNARITGINYTAEHAKLFALDALTWILVAVIAILLVNIFAKGNKLFIGSLAVWLICSFVLVTIYPSAIQAFVVNPNEYEMEKPYLEKHIEFTRKAYDLDKIKIETYLPKDTNKNNLIDASNPSLSDLRLWDYRPLTSSYNQLQSIRPYYTFTDIDIDRYQTKNGQQRQVMIAARELNTDRLSEARTWINFHLTYTHGYGMAANPVNQFTSQGQPVFIARDLPPKSDPNFPALTVNNPGIYFGELTNNYIIVNTRTKEFDFPKGEENVYTSYEGIKGIPLGSPLIRFLMALRFQEQNFVLSSQLISESSVLMYRNIRERAQKLAPFLIYDDDPYIVVSGGKLYWIIDAYTASAYYPYTKLHSIGLNYIRNSVKTVIDAYSGEVDFYIIDQTDPIINVWSKVFPHLFKTTATLSPDLQRHFRYPEFLLTIQRDMLLQYHMTDPKTFYAKEDSWEVPSHNQYQLFEPYYVTLKLPLENKAEFVMMQPFTPKGKQNLIAWLIARCDQPNYGQLILYKLPKDQNIYGPTQIDSRINQDPTISQLVTLWSQQQSRVTWGNLLIIPIKDSILYVKPMYMESETGKQAELKKIVMVYQDQVLVGNTIAETLNKISINPVTEETAALENAEQTANMRKAEIIKRLQELVTEQQKLINELNGI